MSIDYSVLTNDYLRLFDELWFQTLSRMECSHKQLSAGSRLRPQLVLWGYLAVNEWNTPLDLRTPAYAAVSIELVHKASLLLDDWIDDDDERHGEAAFHAEYGEHTAVMTAMKLVSESINHLLHSKLESDIILASLNLLGETASSMSNGVLAELTLDEKTMFNLDLVKKIAQMETSEIIGNALQIGFVLNGKKNNVLSAYLKKIGDLSGYMFQALNDLESFSNVVMNRQHKGHENFDFNRNRKNIVVAYMYSLLTEKEKLAVKGADVAAVIQLYEKHHIKRLILRETELVFNEIVKLIESTVQYGASQKWVEGYLWFVYLLRQVASKRISV